MAAPTIVSVSPSTVWTGGQLIDVRGTGFRLPAPAPAAQGRLPAPLPTVSVTVGGEACSGVAVFDSTELTCFVPRHDVATGLDLVVQNLDDNGAPIPGESVTLAHAIACARPALDTSVVVDSDRVTRQLVRELKRQVLENVEMFTHTDYETDLSVAKEFAHIAKLPALGLLGPSLTEDRDYTSNEAPAISRGGNTFGLHKAWVTYKFGYTLTVLTDNTAQLQALKQLVALFFERNARVTIQRDVADATAGTISYDMEIAVGASLQDTTRPNPDNLRVASVEFSVRGVNLEDVQGFPGESLDGLGRVVEDVVLATQG